MKNYTKIMKSIKKRRIALYAVLVLFVAALGSAFIDERAFAVNGTAFAVYTFLFVYTVFRESKSTRLSSDSPLLSAMTLDFITGSSKPAVIVNKSLIFASITLPEEEYTLYKKLFHVMHKEVPKPDVYVW